MSLNPFVAGYTRSQQLEQLKQLEQLNNLSSLSAFFRFESALSCSVASVARSGWVTSCSTRNQRPVFFQKVLSCRSYVALMLLLSCVRRKSKSLRRKRRSDSRIPRFWCTKSAATFHNSSRHRRSERKKMLFPKRLWTRFFVAATNHPMDRWPGKKRGEICSVFRRFECRSFCRTASKPVLFPNRLGWTSTKVRLCSVQSDA